MKTSTIAVALTTLLGFAVAAPAPEASPNPSPDEDAAANFAALAKRAPYNVFITEHANWAGRNELLSLNTASCHTLGNGWPAIITSFGPDAGVTCTLFDRAGCTGSQYWPVRSPGFPNLSSIGWNDRIRSFVCV
ncbi:hypothetical protein QBC44DRAFT_298238 [Cladorrhinum sp. PSN332]|nr:hypothetical protein QBC44DRAFT_298238 [Cladorrhinum sp. PSN332]